MEADGRPNPFDWRDRVALLDTMGSKDMIDLYGELVERQDWLNSMVSRNRGRVAGLNPNLREYGRFLNENTQDYKSEINELDQAIGAVRDTLKSRHVVEMEENTPLPKIKGMIESRRTDM